MEGISYIDPQDIVSAREAPLQFSGTNVDGYGRKIATRYMLRRGCTGREHRLYAVCYSNCAIFYIRTKDGYLYLSGESEERVRTMARKGR
jgi:archaeosine-15-forming tRNA-guanine transglycosylase